MKRKRENQFLVKMREDLGNLLDMVCELGRNHQLVKKEEKKLKRRYHDDIPMLMMQAGMPGHKVGSVREDLLAKHFREQQQGEDDDDGDI